jgi:hypothetical protein
VFDLPLVSPAAVPHVTSRFRQRQGWKQQGRQRQRWKQQGWQRHVNRIVARSPDVRSNLTFRLFVNFRQGRREQQGRQRYVHLLLARSPVVQAILTSHGGLCYPGKGGGSSKGGKGGSGKGGSGKGGKGTFRHHIFATNSVQTKPRAHTYSLSGKGGGSRKL